MTVIAIYNPTLQAEPIAKDTFCDELQGLVNLIPRRNVRLIARDRYARMGLVDEYTHYMLGRLFLGEQCESKPVSFSDLNRLVVTTARVQHSKGHPITRHSNDGRTEHQINYILRRSLLSSSTEYCQTCRGGMTGNTNDTDHTGTSSPQFSSFRTAENPTALQSRRAQARNSRQRSSSIKHDYI